MVKNLPTVQEMQVNPGLRGYPGKGDGHPLQYSGLEYSLDRGVWWWATVHGSQRVRHKTADGLTHTDTQTHTHTHTHTQANETRNEHSVVILILFVLN